MKKALFFAILATSINIIAQNNLQNINLHQPTLNLMNNVTANTEDRDSNRTRNCSEWIMEQTFKKQTQEQNSLIQIFDSAYHWCGESAHLW